MTTNMTKLMPKLRPTRRAFIQTFRVAMYLKDDRVIIEDSSKGIFDIAKVFRELLTRLYA